MFLVGVLKFKILQESSITKSFYQITGLLSRIYTLLKKNQIHVKKVGYTSEFMFGFY